jgi:hypothetical protein
LKVKNTFHFMCILCLSGLNKALPLFEMSSSSA